jgi:multimeric flavodoxin WrbA
VSGPIENYCMSRTKIRKGMPDVQISRTLFESRYRDQFFDPAFKENDHQLEAIIETAWSGYDAYRKNPKTRVAGRGFEKPKANLPVEWLETRSHIHKAEVKQRNAKSKSRILLINGSMRSDQSCPGEMSKSWRLLKLAENLIKSNQGFETEVLDLSRLTSEYGRKIHPCKACVSTAMPLCHWPCSCYPNFAMGQTSDWMAEIYPMWVAAHGVMIITPVNWYQAPAGLKAMIDRLVCADGGNPDPTTTDGKDPKLAKAIEIKGWNYPRHLAGRVFSVVVHGDSAGVENLRRILSDWLEDIGLTAAGPKSRVGSYIGYMGTYAESHADLDDDKAIQADVKTAAQALVNAIKLNRSGRLKRPDAGLREAIEK